MNLPVPPALILKPTATGYEDKAGAYTEWLVLEGGGRVRFDLVGGAGGAVSSFAPSYLTEVTDASLAGGGTGTQPACGGAVQLHRERNFGNPHHRGRLSSRY